MPSEQVRIRKIETFGSDTRTVSQRIIARLHQDEPVSNGVGTQEERGSNVQVAYLFHRQYHILIYDGEDVNGTWTDDPGNEEGLLDRCSPLFLWKKTTHVTVGVSL